MYDPFKKAAVKLRFNFGTKTVFKIEEISSECSASYIFFVLGLVIILLVSHLKSAFFHGICPARFTSSLKLLFSPGPWLGAPLSSYLEGALYKFHR